MKQEKLAIVAVDRELASRNPGEREKRFVLNSVHNYILISLSLNSETS